MFVFIVIRIQNLLLETFSLLWCNCKAPNKTPSVLGWKRNYKLQIKKLQIKNKKLRTNKPSPELLIGVEAKCIRWQCQRAARFPLLLFHYKHYLLLLHWNDFFGGNFDNKQSLWKHHSPEVLVGVVEVARPVGGIIDKSNAELWNNFWEIQCTILGNLNNYWEIQCKTLGNLQQSLGNPRQNFRNFAKIIEKSNAEL